MTPVPIQPVSSPEYWRERIGKALRREEIHRAVYETTKEDWDKIENHQRRILSETIREHDSILDIGCSWGRLIPLMPKYWKGKYTGIDISPDFIEMGRLTYPEHIFICNNILTHGWMPHERYDWGIFCSIEGTISKHIGVEVWAEIKASVSKVCQRLLFLDYDYTSRVEICK